MVIQDAIGDGMFKGAHIDGFIPICHICFMRMMIIDWNKANMINMVAILHCFYLVSGLKISLEKSNIVGIGVKRDEVVKYLKIVRCKPGKLPFTYLGLPVGQKMNMVNTWKPI